MAPLPKNLLPTPAVVSKLEHALFENVIHPAARSLLSTDPTRTINQITRRQQTVTPTVTVVTDTDETTTEVNDPDDASTLSGGAIAGIVIGSIAGLILLIWIFKSCSNLGAPPTAPSKGPAWYDGVTDNNPPVRPGGPPVARSRSRHSHHSHARHHHHHSHSRSPRRSAEVREVRPVTVVRPPQPAAYAVYGRDDVRRGRSRSHHRSRSRSHSRY